MAATKVLVVDDEPTVREVVVGYLRRDGHEVAEAGDGNVALELLEAEPPDLVVLDMMLPGVNGLDILRRVRSTSNIPVIMLTARAEESDRVAGLELGADDYVVKPFSPRELAARVNGVLRRTSVRETSAPQPLDFDGLHIDPLSREVTLDGTLVEMTP
ncbi:MAG: response regulator, partial [Actinomycetota bacterium]